IIYHHFIITLPLFFFLLLLPSTVYSVYFQITRFDPSSTDILSMGDVVPSVGAIEMNVVDLYRIGWVVYARKLLLWASEMRKLTNFTTHYSFAIDTRGSPYYGDGLAFFLAPVGFDIPPNSAGGFLGLFNTTTNFSHRNKIVLVELDSAVNSDWDPEVEHVGISNNSLASANYTAWNASLHSGDTADVWITYTASTKKLSVSWKYRTTSNVGENTSLSYEIDLMEVLLEWVIVGFSAVTGSVVERHTLQSWEFNSTLDIVEPNGKNARKKTILVSITISEMILSIFVILWKWKGKKKKTPETMNFTSINDDLEKGAGPRRFSYGDLASATNNFSNERKLGERGFGAVYKGYLIELDIAVAVKKILQGSKQGRKEYLTEVKIISRLRHKNPVQLIGWCHDRGGFLLVYEFMPNGSLDAHLFGKRNPLTWAVRQKIATGLASALLYLHEEWEQCVIQRDIKSSNVMLDSIFNVKLGDFGLARLMDHELGPQTTGLAGTLGYMAPEYITTGRASKELDVYSYGVVTLEIAIGRKPVDLPDKDSAMGLVEWVWNLYGSGRLHMAIDERMNMDFDLQQIKCLMIVGLWCTYPDQSLRPSIRQAIKVINFKATMPNLPMMMHVPLYHILTPLVSSGEPLITTSLEHGR
ncbi:L-type lectin-domain containing receptor kinase IX.1-like, partial [Juglans microcarpa x Juglans regia]|uniref:L-type lectin-domain containing receptor kinase IX.1-like n=1 Tax=Juglans microcarpa x Juglans regia TaxID=2249226 RepID=UPI001B7E4116